MKTNIEQHDLLIEIGTEELPPKALSHLSEAFLDGICSGLEQHKLDYRAATPFSTPRRLAVLVRGVVAKQADQAVERRGPNIKAAFDADGNATKAAQGFARSCGVEVADLARVDTKKGEWLVFRSEQKGQDTTALVPEIVRQALAKLPIPKRMRWGDESFEFVRPVHWVVLLLDKQIIPADILGVSSGRQTHGHRFHHPEAIEIPTATAYAKLLEDKGHVLPVLSVRKGRVKLLVEDIAKQYDGFAIIDEDLLNEVTCLVEYPQAILGYFDEEFLQVPAEALISAMKGHQKYFHMVDAEGKLMPNFITVSNIKSQQPDVVKTGNERVIRPRLSDAKFFWDKDCAQRLDSRIDNLKTVIFEKSLGTVFDKSQRVAELAAFIAQTLDADEALARRAGLLCKCDLLTEMVGEFPDLQGIMGEYYARNDGEDVAVSTAMRTYYLPRFWGDDLPETPIAQALALADRIDSLIGIFGIGKTPTGDKDPYSLRRAAIGIIRIIIELGLHIALEPILKKAASLYPDKVLDATVTQQVNGFILERLPAYYQEHGLSIDSVEAVLSCQPSKLIEAHQRMIAVETFRNLPEAASLAAANKRIHNILKKSGKETLPAQVDPSHFSETAETALFTQLNAVQNQVTEAVANADYSAALQTLASLREPVDHFFDGVMVMDKDETVRLNRLALLHHLRQLFLQIADISKLEMNT